MATWARSPQHAPDLDLALQRQQPQPLRGLAPPQLIAHRLGTACSQNGYLLSRGGCQYRWHSLVSCDHGNSTTGRFDSPSAASCCCTSVS
eukprot:SAG25_NODE_160_length_13390_cov_9.002708_13_plen_90_part_00